MRFNSLVDKLTEKAQSKEASGPQWPRDLLRPQINKLMAEEEDVSPAVKETLRYRFLRKGSPSIDIKVLRLPRRQQRLLLQLRVGACHALGGWRHESPDQCPHCHKAIERLSTTAAEPAVFHVFTCRVRATQLMLRSLWVDMDRAIKHAMWFVSDE